MTTNSHNNERRRNTIDNRIQSLELIYPGVDEVSATKISKVTTGKKTEWMLAVGPVGGPLFYFTGKTIADAVLAGELAFASYNLKHPS